MGDLDVSNVRIWSAASWPVDVRCRLHGVVETSRRSLLSLEWTCELCHVRLGLRDKNDLLYRGYPVMSQAVSSPIKRASLPLSRSMGHDASRSTSMPTSSFIINFHLVPFPIDKPKLLAVTNTSSLPTRPIPNEKERKAPPKMLEARMQQASILKKLMDGTSSGP